ncbi:hypothetical protein MKX03_019677 [Papaver bracteatum]|nr:hypothetical protein MKX03_019677 [Papaver bracteatum]
MVTFDTEDDSISSEDTGDQNFNFDGFDFLEDEEIYSNTLNPGLLENDKDDSPIDDISNTHVVNAGDFAPNSIESPDTSHLYTTDKRGGVYRIHKSKREISVMIGKRKTDTGSKKRGCPFLLSVLCGGDSLWCVSVRNGFHNHENPESLVGHSSSCLTKEQYEKVIKLRSSGMRPIDIVGVLKNEYPGITTHIKVIYNSIHKYKRVSSEGRTTIQEFMHLCEENKYFSRKRTNIKGEVTELFFAHPMFVNLANTFHNFVILENTYKTNMYSMPLLNIVIHTSTKSMFTVALCFMQFEQEGNFVWALERLKEL